MGGLVAAVVVCALHASATAQGYAPPPPGGGGGPAEPAGAMTGYRWSAGLLIGVPQQDLADGADTSVGFRAAIGYNLNPNLSGHASFRYILVSAEDDGVDISYRDFGLGGRYTFGSSGTITPYVEGELLYSTISVDVEGFGSADESDPAILGRAGGIYKWKPNMDIIFFGSYTIIFVDEDEIGFADASWLELGGAVQGHF